MIMMVLIFISGFKLLLSFCVGNSFCKACSLVSFVSKAHACNRY